MIVTEIVRELEPLAPDPFIAALGPMRPAPTGSGLTDVRGPLLPARPAR